MSFFEVYISILATIAVIEKSYQLFGIPKIKLFGMPKIRKI